MNTLHKAPHVMTNSTTTDMFIAAHDFILFTSDDTVNGDHVGWLLRRIQKKNRWKKGQQCVCSYFWHNSTAPYKLCGRI